MNLWWWGSVADVATVRVCCCAAHRSFCRNDLTDAGARALARALPRMTQAKSILYAPVVHRCVSSCARRRLHVPLCRRTGPFLRYQAQVGGAHSAVRRPFACSIGIGNDISEEAKQALRDAAPPGCWIS